MPLRCIVADDEPLAKKLIENYIERTPGLELAASFTSASEAAKAIAEKKGQLAFLDIQMPGINGIQLARNAEQAGIRVVFTTAFRNYAIEGFRVNALDYLLKPVSYEEFLQAAERAMAAIPAETEASDTRPSFMNVRSNYRTVRIDYADIVYVEGLRDYVKIHLVGQERPLLTQMTLKSVEAMLPTEGFVRIHRSYIVSIEQIKAFNRSEVTLADSSDNGTIVLPVGQTYQAHFFEIAKMHNHPAV